MQINLLVCVLICFVFVLGFFLFKSMKALSKQKEQYKDLKSKDKKEEKSG